MDRYIDNGSYVEQSRDSWVAIYDKLSFAGFGRDELYRNFDTMYGEDGWLPAHSFDGEIVSRLEGYYWYEDAYYEYLQNSPLREWIVHTASEVYDIGLSNIQCGLDYTKQECGATHLQDISVRRVLTRLLLDEKGEEYTRDLPSMQVFHGDHSVQIRGHETEGFPLNPGQVPFHKPDLALGTYNSSAWWKELSAEDVYQRNKVLLIKPDRLSLKLAFVTDHVYVAENKRDWYVISSEGLFYRKGRDIRRDAQQGDDPYCEIVKAPFENFEAMSDYSYLTDVDFSKKKLTYGDVLALWI